MKGLLAPVLLPLLLTTAQPLSAGTLVQEFSGSRSARTPVFEVEAPWLIDWRVNSDFPAEMGIAIALFNARDDSYAGRVAKTKYVGDGLRLMSEGGAYYFKVDATLTNWTIRVEQLNEGEEQMYKPKNESLLPQVDR